MRIRYNGADLSEEETDEIINVWKRINYELIWIDNWREVSR